LSDADAETVTVPEMLAPDAGDVMLTVGGVVSETTGVGVVTEPEAFVAALSGFTISEETFTGSKSARVRSVRHDN
jgi:hypothetical protein